MSINLILELIGYLGSALVIVSMLMTSVVKLRIINTIGSVIFCAYALAIHSYPTAAMQVCLIIINIINLYKLNNTKKQYSAVNVSSTDGFLYYFLCANERDIKKFFPDFSTTEKDDTIFMITCGQAPAGVFIAKDKGDGSFTVKLDYTTPAYRDCSAGKFIYNHLKLIGVRKVYAETNNPAHQKYLQKLGFSTDRDSNNFVKIL
ncbi:YgjV family protein [Treponema bryantii]|uniref:YgjV family protein n=1 Tax=Treponema bryantii TaxID=163 RepID=UPI0003B32275|nr:YgjV family protein [Treponema bryantii]